MWEQQCMYISSSMNAKFSSTLTTSLPSTSFSHGLQASPPAFGICSRRIMPEPTTRCHQPTGKEMRPDNRQYSLYREICFSHALPLLPSTKLRLDGRIVWSNTCVEQQFFPLSQERGFPHLRRSWLLCVGIKSTYDLMFKVSDAVHEAPVYVQSLNRLYVSRLAPPPVC